MSISGTANQDKIMAPGDKFYWTLDDKTFEADNAFFRAQLGAIKTWDISGSSGRIMDGDYFQFFISIPYEEVLIEKTYILWESEGFRMIHTHSVPPELNPVATPAYDAELTIRLDPAKGIAEGDFNAKFLIREGYRLEPKGAFKVTKV